MATGEWVGSVGDERARGERGESGSRGVGEERGREERGGEGAESENTSEENSVVGGEARARSIGQLCLAHRPSIASRRALFTSCDVAICGLVRTSRNARSRSNTFISPSRVSSVDEPLHYVRIVDLAYLFHAPQINVNLSYFYIWT